MVYTDCYEQMLQLIERRTGMVARKKVPGLGHQGWVLTGPAGETAVVLLKGCAFKPARRRWFSGIGIHQVEALAGCRGFTVVGLCDDKGSRLVHVLVIPGEVVDAWGAQGLLRNPQVTSSTEQWKLNICAGSGGCRLGSLHGLRLDAYLDSYHLLA